MNTLRLQLTQLLYFLCLVVLLLGCGGGGGSGGGTGPSAQPPTNQPPTPSFDASATTGNAPLIITVNAESSSDPDGQISQFTWDFDGNVAIGVIAQHTFDSSGTFVVSLTVTDNDGERASTSQTVTVTDSVTTITLNGVVNILSSSAVDSDLNDRLTNTVANNDFSTAQTLPSTVTLGGFINLPNTGASTGNLFSTGDPADFYQVSLNGDEIITLDIAQASADLDLRLWDAQENLLDASLGATNTETLEVPGPGTYYVEVVPFAGASNYVLSIGQRSTTTMLPRSATRLSDPILPGELIVQQVPRLNQPGQHSFNTENYHASLIRQFSEPDVNLRNAPKLYTVLQQHAQAAATQGALTGMQAARWHTLMALKEFAHLDQVEYAEPNLLVQAHVAPNDEFFGSQWHYPAINLPTAWDTTTGSADVIVAVIDTGVLLTHPDLRNKFVPGYDFISSAARALDGDGIDDNPDDPGDRDLGGSSSFHGTHVAGTIAADSNNQIGVAGVAWQTRLMPLRVLGKGGGSTFDIIQAVRFAAGLDNNSNTLPSQRADIINLSLGGTFSSQSEQTTYAEAIAAGVIVIASAGNESTSLPSYPAAYDGVIGVAANHHKQQPGWLFKFWP